MEFTNGRGIDIRMMREGWRGLAYLCGRDVAAHHIVTHDTDEVREEQYRVMIGGKLFSKTVRLSSALLSGKESEIEAFSRVFRDMEIMRLRELICDILWHVGEETTEDSREEYLPLGEDKKDA